MKFKINDKVIYQETEYVIEKEYSPNVFLIGNSASYCDLVPGSLLTPKVMRKQDWWIKREALLKVLGLPNKLPKELDWGGTIDIPLGWNYSERCHTHTIRGIVIISKQWNRRDHRIFIVCPNCKKAIPFGRMHQHYETKKCWKNALGD
jgi:hypothetical protein